MAARPRVADLVLADGTTTLEVVRRSAAGAVLLTVTEEHEDGEGGESQAAILLRPADVARLVELLQELAR